MRTLLGTALVLAWLASVNAVAAQGRSNMPAAACIQGAANDAVRYGDVATFVSYSYGVNDKGQSIEVHCPIAVETGGASPTGPKTLDLNKVRVHYFDGDGFGAAVSVSITLIRYRLVTNGMVPQGLCSWSSNTAGSGSNGIAVATFTCPHKLDPAYFYHFRVNLSTEGATAKRSAAFYGMDFPS